MSIRRKTHCVSLDSSFIYFHLFSRQIEPKEVEVASSFLLTGLFVFFPPFSLAEKSVTVPLKLQPSDETV